MPQRVMTEEGGAFWHELDLEMREELELGVLTPNIWLEDVGRWVWWGPAPEPAPEGPPLLPLGAGPMEVDGAKQAQDGASVEDDTTGE